MTLTVQNLGHISKTDAQRIVKVLYDLTAELDPLPGYLDDNFVVRSGAGEKHVLKISHPNECRDVLEFQNQAIKRLIDAPGIRQAQQILPTVDGGEIGVLQDEHGSTRFVRLLTFIEGTFLADIKPQSDGLLLEWGRFYGRVDQALDGLEHPAAHRPLEWDLKRAPEQRKHLPHVTPIEIRQLVAHFLGEFDIFVLPKLAELRTRVIQNDGNDLNLLVGAESNEAQDIVGVIDFGDCVHSCTVFEPAIAATYAAMGKEDPLAAAGTVLKGYHQIHPLTDDEIDIIYHLIAARLCTSICMSSSQKRLDPTNTYLDVSQQSAHRLLRTWAGIEPSTAARVFRSACQGDRTPSATASTKTQLLEKRRRYFPESLSVSYQTPLKIARGCMQYLYDETGRAYLDAVNNVPHVGHCHPHVVREMQRQIAVLNTNTRYLYEKLVQYAERLCAYLPDPLNICFFVNSGSEANDLALRLARTHTDRKDMIVLEGAYHGNLTSLVEISPYKFDGPGGPGAPTHVHPVTMPEVYRGPFKRTDPKAGEHYAELVDQAIGQAERQGRGIAAMICEAVMGCGGQVVFPPGFLEHSLKHLRKCGALLIADEVQVGLGRMGSHFWAFEIHGVIPDIVTVGKPIGNGHPLAAVITTPEIAQSFNTGMEYFNTYGGNPVSCAAGMAVLDVIENEQLQQNASVVGDQLLEGLRSLQHRHDLIGDVRGQGLFIGIELVLDQRELTPAPAEAKRIVEKMKDNGILISVDGPLNNVLKIKPPLVFTKDNAQQLVETLDTVLSDKW